MVRFAILDWIGNRFSQFQDRR